MIELTNEEIGSVNGSILRYYEIYQLAQDAAEFAHDLGYWFGSGRWP